MNKTQEGSLFVLPLVLEMNLKSIRGLHSTSIFIYDTICRILCKEQPFIVNNYGVILSL